MRCFRHADAEAVAICTNCGKGLCRSCAKESDGLMACAGPCGAKAAARQRLIEASGAALRGASANSLNHAAVFALIGGGAIGYGLLFGERLLAVTGIVVLFFGARHFRSWWRARR